MSGGVKMQARIAQKYIERPFLIKKEVTTAAGKIKHEYRKFDLRQWVLVTSFNPLKIYMFNTCYIKICGSEWSLKDLKDKFKHLSNYSVQKKNARVENVKSDLIMSQSEFIQHLKQHFYK